MKHGIYKLTIFLFGWLLSSVVWASAPVEQLAERLNQVKTLQANFLQQLFNSHHILQEEQRGHLQLKKPKQFRWQVTEPDLQLTLSDGEQIWFYDEDLEQVTIHKVSEQHHALPIYLLLSGKQDDILNHYQVEGLQDEHTPQCQLPGNCYRLLSQDQEPQSGFLKIELIFSQDKIASLSFWDQLGQKTKLSFSNVVVDEPILEQRFIFIAPPGVDVVGAPVNN